MSTITAYNSLGQGLDMSALRNGAGVFVNDGSTRVVYLYDLDFDTALFAISGAPPIRYMTISIGDIDGFGNVLVSDIGYYNGRSNYVLRWDDANVIVNIYDDFSFGTIADILWGPDEITGNSYNDVIKGGYGDDYLKGQGGNDRLYGEGDNDLLSGGGGNDQLNGGFGDDLMAGDSGADILNGQAGDDDLVWDRSDTVIGGAGDDWLLCGSLNLNTLANNRIVGVEGLDMRDSGNNTITLKARDLMDLSGSTNVIGILGDAGDRVNVVGFFVYTGTDFDFGIDSYAVGGATLLVNSEVIVY